MSNEDQMCMLDRNLALELSRVTELTALGCQSSIGRGDEKGADQEAVKAMRKALGNLNIYGVVVIGEGERDKAPMLYIGEEVGLIRQKDSAGKPQVDVALDPLEGTTICSKWGRGALSILAVAKKGQLLHAPDVYMEKIACGPKAYGSISLEIPLEENVKKVSQVLGKPPSEMRVVILDRPRHRDLIQKVRQTKARVQLIGDGDVSAALLTCLAGSEVDLLLGTGGAPEGVITAAAFKCIGGDFLGRLCFQNEEEKNRAQQMGVQDLNKIYTRDELVQGDAIFSATGVTDGPLLQGVKKIEENQYQTQSLLTFSKGPEIRKITTEHFF